MAQVQFETWVAVRQQLKESMRADNSLHLFAPTCILTLRKGGRAIGSDRLTLSSAREGIQALTAFSFHWNSTC